MLKKIHNLSCFNGNLFEFYLIEKFYFFGNFYKFYEFEQWM